MISYFIPFIFLTILTIFEYSKKFNFIVKNKFLYSAIALFFIIFIGLRYEIGCDWFQYKGMFEKYNSISLIDIIRTSLSAQKPGYRIQELGHIFITFISKNIYILNLIYSILFTLPLFYFCSQLKRTYFSLLISYPYYIIVVGMGPIRQAVCISLLILLVSKRKYYSHISFTIISSLLHQSSILLNGLILGSSISNFKKVKLSQKNIFFVLLLSLILLFSSPTLIGKVYFYISSYKELIPGGGRLISPAKGAYYIWFINFVPSIIFLKNIAKFRFEKSLKNILIILTTFEFLLLPIIFLNSVIAYRLLLYLFPSSILITSYIPDLELLKIKKFYSLNIIISVALLSLIIWLKFAFHSSCWTPYKNILFYN